MGGYIGKGQGVVLVDGYTQAETDTLIANAKEIIVSSTAPSSPAEGDVWYDSSSGNKVLKYYDGSNWYKISSAIPSISAVTGNIYAGESSTLTFTGTNFLTTNLVINFTQSSDAIDVDVTVTPISQTSASVSVPSSVYNSVTGGNDVTITVTNSDLVESNPITKTATALPTGGTITTSGNYRIHTFTSSGTFTNTLANKAVEYLVVAGGGGGGGGDKAPNATANTGGGGGGGGPHGPGGSGGGGGAGGFRTNVSGATSGRNSSTEAAMTLSVTSYAVTVGGGGSGNNDAGGSNGSVSSFNSISSTGGGGGGSYTAGIAQAGGSGGGGDSAPSSANQGKSGTTGQGFDGGDGYSGYSAPYAGGGGGGAGGNGGNASSSVAGNGGTGIQSSITGSATYYAGGGGGGGQTSSSNGSGGAGGGSNGANGSDLGNNNGGSGIVIIRYEI